MDKSKHDLKTGRTSVGVQLIAIYLLILGADGLFSIASTFASKPDPDIAEYSLRLAFSALYAISGAAILLRTSWCLTIAIIALVVTIPTSAKDFAWAFASHQTGRPPSLSLLLVSAALLTSWHLALAYLLYKNRTRSGDSQQERA